MQYIEELLNAKKLDINAILSSPCRLTVKEDGTALQVKYEDNRLCFGKRSWDPSKLTKPLTEIDRFMSASYDNAYMHLSNYVDIIKQYDILNFELISSKEQHIMKYTNERPYKIILLSAWKNGEQIKDYDNIISIAESLEVSHVQQINTNALPEQLIKELIKIHEDPNNPDEPFMIFRRYYHIDALIEGLVINFFTEDKVRTYKIQNPWFKMQLVKHLNEEKENKNSIDCSYAYKHIMNTYEQYKDKKFIPKNKMELLLNIWYVNMTYVNNELLNNIKKIEQIKEKDISGKLFAKNYPDYYKFYINNSQEIRDLLVFIILAFQNIRIKQPLWCDMDFQVNSVNTFLNKVYNDISNTRLE